MARRFTYRKFLSDKPTHRKYGKEFEQAKAQNKYWIFWLLILFSLPLVIYLLSIFN